MSGPSERKRPPTREGIRAPSLLPPPSSLRWPALAHTRRVWCAVAGGASASVPEAPPESSSPSHGGGGSGSPARRLLPPRGEAGWAGQKGADDCDHVYRPRFCGAAQLIVIPLTRLTASSPNHVGMSDELNASRVATCVGSALTSRRASCSASDSFSPALPPLPTSPPSPHLLVFCGACLSVLCALPVCIVVCSPLAFCATCSHFSRATPSSYSFQARPPRPQRVFPPHCPQLRLPARTSLPLLHRTPPFMPSPPPPPPRTHCPVPLPLRPLPPRPPQHPHVRPLLHSLAPHALRLSASPPVHALLRRMPLPTPAVVRQLFSHLCCRRYHL